MRRVILLVLWFLFAGSAFAADLTLYESENYNGRRFEVDWPIDDFSRFGFSDNASSLVISRGNWQVCGERYFRGRCIVLGPGRFPSLASMGLNDRISSVRPITGDGGGWAGGHEDIEFFLHDDFQGRSVGVDGPVSDFRGLNLNDEVSSIIVRRRNWQLCTDGDFRGRCVVLTPGRYRSLTEIGLNDKISSARPAGNDGPGPRGDITLFEHSEFQGRRYDSDRDIPDFAPFGLNDEVSSVVIERGQWELCVHSEYRGRCIQLGPGRYPSLDSMGLNDTLSSARRVGGWGGGGWAQPRPPIGPIDARTPEVSACWRELDDRIHRERREAGQVQLLEREVRVIATSSESTRILGYAQYELPRGWKRASFECSFSYRTGWVSTFKWDD